MLLQRTVSALFLIPLVFVSIWFGEPWFSIVVSLAALLGITEFYSMAGQGRLHPFTVFGTLWTLFFIFAAYYTYETESQQILVTSALIASAILISLVISIFSRIRNGGTLGNWAWTVAGIFYIGWLLSYWVLIMDSSAWVGRDWVLIALFSTFAVDTTAFFIGRAYGRHKLAPRISPSKTWEGAAGGLAGGLAAVFVLALLLDVNVGFRNLTWLGLLIGVFAQLGDLTESGIKRSIGIKESGSMIPGHGGILDRLDSVLITGVVVYYFLRWFI